MRQVVATFFATYERALNDALKAGGTVDDIVASYADTFVIAEPAGVVGHDRDAAMRAAVAADMACRRSSGVRSMTIMGLRIEAIDRLHAIAFIDWAADRADETGRATIDFRNAYLVRVEEDRVEIFGAVTGGHSAMAHESVRTDAESTLLDC